MAYLTELDVINDQLATLGQAPLNNIDEGRPMVAGGLRMLRVASYREQAKGWWFNKELLTLTVDPGTSKITIPSDCISVDPTDTLAPYVQRGRFLYNTAKGSFLFTSSVDVRLTRNVAFTDLPVAAATYIGTSSVLQFQRSYDADAKKTSDLRSDLADALVALNAEHTRNINANLLNNAAVMRKVQALGSTLSFGSLRNS